MIALLTIALFLLVRYLWVARGPEQQAQPLTVGHMIWRQATHALEHINEIRLTRRQHTLYVEQLRDAVDELAIAYADTANGHLNESPAERMHARLSIPTTRIAAPTRSGARS